MQNCQSTLLPPRPPTRYSISTDNLSGCWWSTFSKVCKNENNNKKKNGGVHPRVSTLIQPSFQKMQNKNSLTPTSFHLFFFFIPGHCVARRGTAESAEEKKVTKKGFVSSCQKGTPNAPTTARLTPAKLLLQTKISRRKNPFCYSALNPYTWLTYVLHRCRTVNQYEVLVSIFF